MTTKTKVGLFVAIFSVFLVAYLLLPLFPAAGDLVGLFDIFKDPNVNFIFLVISFLSISLVITFLFHLFCCLMIDERSDTFKIGEAMVSEGFITAEDLEAALQEQSYKLGEILVSAGRLTPEQRDNAIKIQKKTKTRIGEILIRYGYTTQEDIDWALNKMERKIGEILKDKKALSDYDLTCALSLNKCRIDGQGKIFIVK